MPKILTAVDLAQNELQNAVIQNLAAAPGSPKKGQVYFNTTSTSYQYYDGSAWQTLSTSTGTGNVSKAANATAANVLQVSGGTDKTIADYAPGGTGLVKVASSGVPSLATAGSDYLTPTGNGAGLTGITESQVANLVSDLAAKAPTASPTFTGSVTVPSPVNPSDAASKGYVDSTVQGLQVKPTARLATAAALPANSYANGSAGVGATLTATANAALTVDGVAVAVGDVILVKNETASATNGLYTVTAAGSGAAAYVLTRHTDMDAAGEFAGAFVPVGNAGTVNANSLWLANPSGAVTVGTTAIPFTQLNGATDLVAGVGITISGNTIAVSTTTVHKFTATIGDGSSTTIAVTDGLGTIDKVAVIRDATTGAQVISDTTYSATQTTFTFGTAPAANAYKVVIEG